MSRAQPIGEILGQLIHDLGYSKKFSEQRVVTDWADVVGERVARHSQALSVNGGRLFVQVDSSVWAQELSLMKRRILAELETRAGDGVIENVHFVVRGSASSDCSGFDGGQTEDHGERQAKEGGRGKR